VAENSAYLPLLTFSWLLTGAYMLMLPFVRWHCCRSTDYCSKAPVRFATD